MKCRTTTFKLLRDRLQSLSKAYGGLGRFSYRPISNEGSPHSRSGPKTGARRPRQEETGAKSGAKSVDEDVLERLVDAVTRAPANPEDSVEGGNAANAVRNPNEGHGLVGNALLLFERTILPRVGS